MRLLLHILLATTCLLSACQTQDPTPSFPIGKDACDSAAIYQAMAYQEMFADSLAKAETHAYRAFMLSRDSTVECGALSLLCYIYYREGKQQQLQLLMQTISPETYISVMDVQLQVEKAKAGRQRQYYALAIVVLLLAFGTAGYWYVNRMRMLTQLYRQRIANAKTQLGELEQTTETQSPPIDVAKAGVDVLFAIINDQNISQMGKREEQAVAKTLPVIDRNLAAILGKAATPLTPKETFFCIMEYYGKNDKQKARCFCCSEQAIRSTKSRLNKKIDLTSLHPE